MIAGREAGHALAHVLDNPGALVPEHGRRIAGGIGAAGRVEIGVTDAAGRQAHKHLTGAGPVELDVTDDERLGELLENCGADLHGRETNRPAASAHRPHPRAASGHRDGALP